MSNNALYMIVTVIFMIGLAVIGILISRGIKDTEDWMVASKSPDGWYLLCNNYFCNVNYELHGLLLPKRLVWMVECSRYASDFFPCMYVLCEKNASE